MTQGQGYMAIVIAMLGARATVVGPVWLLPVRDLALDRDRAAARRDQHLDRPRHMLPFIAIILSLMLSPALLPAAGVVHPIRARCPMSATDPTPVAPLENRTLREQVFDHLREEILSSRLAPGTELGEVALARSLGISRGPLREALGQLAAEGLVTIVPRRGAVVTRLTRQEFIDAYEVREALESLAIRLAVPRLRSARRPSCTACAEAMERAAAAGDTDALLRDQPPVPPPVVQASGNRKLEEVHAQLIAQMGRLMSKSVELRGGPSSRPPSTGRSSRRSTRATPSARRDCSRSTSRYPSACCGQAEARAIFEDDDTTNQDEEGGRWLKHQDPLEFGVNLNNREPLIAPDYDLQALLDLSHARGGARLRLRMGRRQPVLEAALRGDDAALGDLAANQPRPARHGLPGHLDAQPAVPRARVGDARFDLGRAHDPRALHGQPRAGGQARVRGARAARSPTGRPCSRRASRCINELFRTGTHQLQGQVLQLRRRRLPFAARRWRRCSPLQKPPPIWVVSNPRLVGDKPTEKMRAIMERACDRIIRLGDGWMTCCRAEHPEELTEQIGYLRGGGDASRARLRRLHGRLPGDDEHRRLRRSEARAAFGDYISKYYPELSRAMDLSNWGPVGTPEDITAWLREFQRRGVTPLHLPLRGDRPVRAGERFAREVLPPSRPRR